MTKPVTGQTTFGSNTTGTTTQLDNNFLLAYTALNDLNTYSNFFADTGSANSVVVTLAANLTGTLTNGLLIQVKVAATNSGAATLNYNAGGALNILNLDGTALVAGQLVTGAICSFQYRSSDTSWLLQTPALVPSVAAAGGGSLVLLQANQAANSNAIFFNNLISSSYDAYVLKASGVKLAGNDSSLIVRVGNGNTPTFQATGYLWAGMTRASTGSVSQQGSNTSSTGMYITAVAASAAAWNGANAVLTATVNLHQSSNANSPVPITAESSYVASVGGGGQAAFSVNGGYWDSNQVVTSVQLLPSNANITSGNFALYGIKRA